jgi:hypothetical protein
MSRGTHEIRRAAKEFYCTWRRGHLIKKGDLHLYSAMPPEDELYGDRKSWQVWRVCLPCAERELLHTEKTRAQLEAKR